MKILAIDPGPEESAYVILQDDRLIEFAKAENAYVMAVVNGALYGEAVLEMVASYGMAVGKEVFETVFWIGRFYELARKRADTHRLFRQDIKLHLCKSAKANDASIRQALIDRYGPGKDKAIGKKASPGPLYGVSSDVWAALALGVTWQDTRAQRLAV